MFVGLWSHPPGALEEADGGEVVSRLEQVGFSGSFVQDAQAVELHDQSRLRPDNQCDKAQSHESIIPTLLTLATASLPVASLTVYCSPTSISKTR